MSLPIQVALVPDGSGVNASELTQVAGAISKQVQQDFGPIWGVQATVSAYTRLEDVPIGAWPVIITTQDLGDAGGFHTNKHGQPRAYVALDNEWPLSASHECLEMLADPSGHRLHTGHLMDQAIHLGLQPGPVKYLVEVCDPSEAGKFSYHVNGVTVSDFYTPSFFDPVKSPSGRYSFTGAIQTPLTVLEGGYITWIDPVSDHLMQLRVFADQFSSSVPHILDLTNKTALEKLVAKGATLRAAVDRVTKPPQFRDTLAGEKLASVRIHRDANRAAQAARAKDLRNELQSKIKSSKTAEAATKEKRR
jgi:hypothetical protein